MMTRREELSSSLLLGLESENTLKLTANKIMAKEEKTHRLDKICAEIIFFVESEQSYDPVCVAASSLTSVDGKKSAQFHSRVWKKSHPSEVLRKKASL